MIRRNSLQAAAGLMLLFAVGCAQRPYQMSQMSGDPFLSPQMESPAATAFAKAPQAIQQTALWQDEPHQQRERPPQTAPVNADRLAARPIQTARALNATQGLAETADRHPSFDDPAFDEPVAASAGSHFQTASQSWWGDGPARDPEPAFESQPDFDPPGSPDTEWGLENAPAFGDQGGVAQEPAFTGDAPFPVDGGASTVTPPSAPRFPAGVQAADDWRPYGTWTSAQPVVRPSPDAAKAIDEDPWRPAAP